MRLLRVDNLALAEVIVPADEMRRPSSCRKGQFLELGAMPF